MKAPDKIYIQTNAGEALSSKWTTIPFKDFENTEYIRKEVVEHIIRSALGPQDALNKLRTLKESDKCKGCNNVKGCIACVDGDQWAHYEEPVCEELEDAAYNYVMDTFGNPKQSLFDYDQQCFIAGANWQKKQMMKEAVEGEIVQDMKGLFHAKSTAFVSDNEYDFGQKVKLIICKED